MGDSQENKKKGGDGWMSGRQVYPNSWSPFSNTSIFQKLSTTIRWRPRPWILICKLKLKVFGQGSYTLNSFSRSILLSCGFPICNRLLNWLHLSRWWQIGREKIFCHILFKASTYDLGMKRKFEMGFTQWICGGFAHREWTSSGHNTMQGILGKVSQHV